MKLKSPNSWDNSCVEGSILSGIVKLENNVIKPDVLGLNPMVGLL